MSKAQQELSNAQSLQAQKVDKSLVIAAAREAAQTAEDARVLAVQRAKDAELAQANAAAAQQQQFRIAAEAQARQAQAQAAQAQAQVAQAQAQAVQAQAQASADRVQLETAQQQQATQAAAPNPPQVVVTPETIPQPPPLPNDRQRQQLDLRVSLLQRINGSLPSRDTPQGLIATVADGDFHGTTVDMGIMSNLGRIAALVAAYLGLNVEVDGCSDSASPEADQMASARAAMVRDALIRGGLPYSAVTSRSLGNSRPRGSNATAQGRELNRRVEIVISGAPVGNLASWDKSYSVVPR
jgi:outer membrane protein OmpA-like peptidoglycan-associated protein